MQVTYGYVILFLTRRLFNNKKHLSMGLAISTGGLTRGWSEYVSHQDSAYRPHPITNTKQPPCCAPHRYGRTGGPVMGMQSPAGQGEECLQKMAGGVVEFSKNCHLFPITAPCFSSHHLSLFFISHILFAITMPCCLSWHFMDLSLILVIKHGQSIFVKLNVWVGMH